MVVVKSPSSGAALICSPMANLLPISVRAVVFMKRSRPIAHSRLFGVFVALLVIRTMTFTSRQIRLPRRSSKSRLIICDTPVDSDPVQHRLRVKQRSESNSAIP